MIDVCVFLFHCSDTAGVRIRAWEVGALPSDLPQLALRGNPVVDEVKLSLNHAQVAHNNNLDDAHIRTCFSLLGLAVSAHAGNGSH